MSRYISKRWRKNFIYRPVCCAAGNKYFLSLLKPVGSLLLMQWDPPTQSGGSHKVPISTHSNVLFFFSLPSNCDSAPGTLSSWRRCRRHCLPPPQPPHRRPRGSWPPLCVGNCQWWPAEFYLVVFGLYNKGFSPSFPDLFSWTPSAIQPRQVRMDCVD